MMHMKVLLLEWKESSTPNPSEGYTEKLLNAIKAFATFFSQPSNDYCDGTIKAESFGVSWRQQLCTKSFPFRHRRCTFVSYDFN